jgi:hypothetical protein
MRRFVSISLYVATLGIAGCGDFLLPNCGCPKSAEFLSIGDGVYEPHFDSEYEASVTSAFPHVATDVTNLAMRVNREMKIVEFRYFRGTTEVVEKWAIVEEPIR